MNGPNILIASGTGVSVGSFQGEGVWRLVGEALSSHFRSRPAGEFAERVAVGAEDDQDALLGERNSLFGGGIFRGVVEAQTLRFGQ